MVEVIVWVGVRYHEWLGLCVDGCFNSVDVQVFKYSIILVHMFINHLCYFNLYCIMLT